MPVVSQSEVMASLPRLLREVDKEAVAIESEGREVAYLVSPREYATTREAKTRRLLEAMSELQDEVAKNASEKGLDLNELAKDLDRKRA